MSQLIYTPSILYSWDGTINEIPGCLVFFSYFALIFLRFELCTPHIQRVCMYNVSFSDSEQCLVTLL